jgi:capsular polysaccharide biosynthesis protein
MQENNNEFNSFSLINYIWKWRKMFLIVCGLAGALGFVFSTKFFIRPQYKATTIIYAPRTNSVSKILTNDNNINERLDVKAYAVEEETEQMMQLLHSRIIKDTLINRYDLANYYGITTEAKGWKAKTYKSLEGFMDITRTRYGAISITVTDWNPEQAALMANDIAAELDSLKNRTERERALAACSVLEKMITDAEAQRQLVVDSMKKLAKQGVMLYEYQVERVMQQHAIALAQGNMPAVQRLQKEIDKLNEWGPVSFALQKEQMQHSEQIAILKAKLLNAQADYSQVMPVKFVIEKAVAPDKKSYPKKLVIAILSSIGTFIIMLMALLLYDKIIREIRVETIPPTHSKKQE